MDNDVRPVAGFECKAYLNNGTVGTPVWVEMKQVEDLSQPDSADKIEASARWSRSKKYIAGQQDSSVGFAYLYVKGSVDVVFNALQEAYYSGTALHIAVADGPIAAVGTTYSKDFYVCNKLDNGEEMGSAKKFDVELSPTPYFVSGALQEKTFVTVAA